MFVWRCLNNEKVHGRLVNITDFHFPFSTPLSCSCKLTCYFNSCRIWSHHKLITTARGVALAREVAEMRTRVYLKVWNGLFDFFSKFDSSLMEHEIINCENCTRLVCYILLPYKLRFTKNLYFSPSLPVRVHMCNNENITKLCTIYMSTHTW